MPRRAFGLRLGTGATTGGALVGRPAAGFCGSGAIERDGKIGDQRGKRSCQHLAPRDDHEIAGPVGLGGKGLFRGGAQTAPDAVALNGIADLAGSGQAEAQAVTAFFTRGIAHLRREGRRTKTAAMLGRRQKLFAFGQTGVAHGDGPVFRKRRAGHAPVAQADRRLRPCARRAAMTLRPPFVAIRAR